MMRLIKQGQARFRQQCTLVALLLAAISLSYAATTLNIPQVPLIMATPSHPQVFIAIGNSESMDGTLSGAIMTGSGSLASNASSLNASSSPTLYSVPSGFTPPIQAADLLGNAPYTVQISGRLYDNSASRLNVAKAGVSAIIENYMESSDFALGTYNISNAQPYNTWVYYMSPANSNFTFSLLPPTGPYVNNPCFNYLLATSTIRSNCASIAALYGSSVLSLNPFMRIGASSDDPSINDVLYASSSLASVFVTYNGPNPSTPFPPNFSLTNYNNAGVTVNYSSSAPNIGSFGTSPTNAGYVPFSRQVMYAQRGFGYYGTQSANSGRILVPMLSAGISPTTATVTNAINQFTPFLAPETNNASTSEIKAAAIQSPTAGLLRQANTYLTGLGITSGNCPQKKYVILISDGLPTQDLSGKLWPPLGSASAAGYGVTATFNSDGSLNSTNAQALTDAINTIKTLKSNGIATYIVGLGAGVDPTLNPQAAASLTAMAVAGGTGNYYPATDPQAMVDSLNTIMIAIQNGSFTTSAAAVSSTSLSSSTVAYLANFVSSDLPYHDWTGDLKAIKLNETTGLPTSTTIWSAQAQLDKLVAGLGWSTGRVIATWNPTTNAGVPFRWLNISTAQRLLLQTGILDLLGSTRLDYIRGNAALERKNGGTYRSRSHYLGDIVDSQVLYVGPPGEAYGSASYANFVKTQANRTPFLYVGANDGMLHAFNAQTGIEAFAFIPNGVFASLIDLISPLYNQNHEYFVNGSPISADVQFSNGNWRTLLVGGLNAGGKSVFALDITSPAFGSESALASAVLWEFTDTDMGLTYSQPQIAPIGSASASTMSFAVFVGNGYNSTNNKSVLYALNAQSGSVLRKIDLCGIVPSACNSSLPQGLSSIAVANKDGLQGQPITHVYAGDLQGNLWSIDVTHTNPSNWTVRLLFQARSSGGVVQPITTAPVVTLNPNYPRQQGLFVMFGTGQLLEAADLLDNATQTVYDIWDKPLTTTSYTRSNLQQQTLNYVATASSGLSKGILTVTGNTVNWTTRMGWYADLPIPGQRVDTNPDLIEGAFYAVLNTPPLSTCGTGFSSMLLALNYANGGTFLRPYLDINGDGSVTETDKYNGMFAAGIELKQYSSASTLLGGLGWIIPRSDGTQTVTIIPTTGSRRVGWWQLD